MMLRKIIGKAAILLCLSFVPFIEPSHAAEKITSETCKRLLQVDSPKAEAMYGQCIADPTGFDRRLTKDVMNILRRKWKFASAMDVCTVVYTRLDSLTDDIVRSQLGVSKEMIIDVAEEEAFRRNLNCQYVYNQAVDTAQPARSSSTLCLPLGKSMNDGVLCSDE